MQSRVHPTSSRADCAAAVHLQARHSCPARHGQPYQLRLLVVPAKVVVPILNSRVEQGSFSPGFRINGSYKVALEHVAADT